jgi:speckle-type POZ protein
MMRRALVSGKYQDLVVRCESREWKVHRVILCASSEYFSKACEDTFEVCIPSHFSEPSLIAGKEGISGEINLQEDDPEMVDNMLRFLYTSDYQDDAEGGRPLLVNAKMYAIGDEYRIEALKKLAKTKFSEAFNAGWDVVSFPEVIETVYITTPATDRDLRDCLTPVMLEHKEELHEHEGFVGLIKDKLSDGEFAMDVIHAWTEFRGSKKDSSNTYTQGPWKCKFCQRSITNCPSCANRI